MSTDGASSPERNPDEVICALEEIREGIGLSRDQLAELVETSRTQIYRLEKGLQEPGVKLALRLARVLDLPVEQLWHVPRYEALGVFRGSLPLSAKRKNRRRKMVKSE